MLTKSDERASALACSCELDCACPVCATYLAWTNRRRVEVLDTIIGLMVEEEPLAQMVNHLCGSIVMVDGAIVSDAEVRR